MTPKETVLKAINDFLKDKLLSEGFKFSEAQLCFSRKLKNGFVQKIKFNANLRNYANGMIRYGEQYSVSSNEYKKWWLENFPDTPIIGGGNITVNRSALEGMDRSLIVAGGHYEFFNTDSEQIMNMIWNNYLNHGKIFFEQNETWLKIAKVSPLEYDRVDAYILADNYEQASIAADEVMKDYLDYYKEEEKMGVSVLQTFNILKSRIEFLKEKGYNTVYSK